MSLPGKLCIGYLEEDNPLKSYFRFRPLFERDETGLIPCEDSENNYPLDGFIRIVPDKNESNHFKTRMRQIGLFCALDLRKHPNENDKIRPNKNFREDGPERNSHIVYSDVITALTDGSLAQVIEWDDPDSLPVSTQAAPGNQLILVSCKDTVTGPYRWTFSADQPDTFELEPVERFKAVTAMPQGSLKSVSVGENTPSFTLLIAEEETNSLFELNDTYVAEPVPLVRPVVVPAAPAAPPVPTEKPAAVAAVPAVPVSPAAPVEKPSAPVEKSVENPARPVARPIVPTPPFNRAVPPVAPVRAFAERPAAAAERSVPMPEHPVPGVEKPWIQRDAMLRPRAIPTHLSPREQILLGQTGINPKRSRSISEIIDDQWKKSRLDQLGHPVPAEAMGTPVVSPVEKANNALKEVWALPEARKGLIDEILRLDDVDKAVRERYRFSAAEKPLSMQENETLNEFEAQRLKLLGDIEDLRRNLQQKRTEMLEDIRFNFKNEFTKYEKKNESMKQQAELNTALMEQARTERMAAENALEKLISEDIETLFTERVISDHATDLICRTKSPMKLPEPGVPVYSPAIGELVSGIRIYFENSGIKLSNDDCMNLLICYVISKFVIFSGANGSGKTSTAKLLAQSLGLDGGTRYAFLSPGTKPVQDEDVFKRLVAYHDSLTMNMVVLDDANLLESEDITRGLIAVSEGSLEGMPDNLRFILTVQDAPVGHAISTMLLDRAFFIRFALPELDSSFLNEAFKECVKPHNAAAWSALESLFVPTGEMTIDVEQRLCTLRRKLNERGIRLSARTMRDTILYIKTALPLMACKPMEVLDYALSQRVLPVVLAGAPLRALHKIEDLFADLPRCLNLLTQPLPLPEL